MAELNAIIKHKREAEKRERHFLAGIQGIDLNKNQGDDVQKRVEEVQRRAAVRLAGGEKELEKEELAEFGLDYESD